MFGVVGRFEVAGRSEVVGKPRAGVVDSCWWRIVVE